MQRIRTGNTINLQYSVFVENGEDRIPEDFTGVPVTVVLKNTSYRTVVKTTPVIEGNVINVTIPGQPPLKPGRYNITVIYSKNGTDYALDSDVFAIVERSNEIGGETCCPDVEIMTVRVSGSVVFAGGATLEQIQSNWNETNVESPAFIVNKPTLAKVAASGSYNDLEDKPEMPELPSLATVATTGQYDDLEGIPNIPQWAMQAEKPEYTAQEVGATPAEEGKGLSANDFTDVYKRMLDSTRTVQLANYSAGNYTIAAPYSDLMLVKFSSTNVASTTPTITLSTDPLTVYPIKINSRNARQLEIVSQSFAFVYFDRGAANVFAVEIDPATDATALAGIAKNEYISPATLKYVLDNRPAAEGKASPAIIYCPQDLPVETNRISFVGLDLPEGYVPQAGDVVIAKNGTILKAESVEIEFDRINTTYLTSYATKQYVDDLIGDINTILDNINGEAI